MKEVSYKTIHSGPFANTNWHCSESTSFFNVAAAVKYDRRKFWKGILKDHVRRVFRISDTHQIGWKWILIAEDGGSKLVADKNWLPAESSVKELKESMERLVNECKKYDLKVEMHEVTNQLNSGILGYSLRVFFPFVCEDWPTR